MKVRCIDAKERDIPITEGEIYTVERKFKGAQEFHEECLPGMEQTAGYTLEEVAGYFRADRFEKIDE